MVGRPEGMDGRSVAVLRMLAGREARGTEPPTVREVAEAAGYASSRSGHKKLAALEEAGLVELREARNTKGRRPRLTRRGYEALGEVPLLGRVAAGEGIEAIPVEEAYSLFGELFGPPSGKGRFVLRAQGDSMVGAGISDGDPLLVEADESPPDGTVVVALLPGDRVTVKWLKREGDVVRLRPDNGAYEDIVVPASEVRIQGRVRLSLHEPRPGGGER